MKRRLTIGVFVLACLGVIVVRVFWDGRVSLADGDAAIARGDTREAIAKWRRSARWYAPAAPHVARAYERLEFLATTAQAHGDTGTALDAWRGIRGSILATRSFYVPYAAKLPIANEHIAALMAKTDSDAGKTEAERKAWHLSLLSRDEAPSVAWTLIALLGFACWVGGGFWFSLRGVTDEQRLNVQVAARSGLLVAVGLLVWMLGLYKA